MQESLKIDRNLTNKHDYSLNNYGLSNETELLRILEALSEKIKILENIETTSNETKINDCNFKDDCYVAKSKMGSCPCELYR